MVPAFVIADAPKARPPPDWIVPLVPLVSVPAVPAPTFNASEPLLDPISPALFSVPATVIWLAEPEPAPVATIAPPVWLVRLATVRSSVLPLTLAMAPE